MKIGSNYNLIKEGINASVVRSRAISNNIANVNTRGFKRNLVSFEENLKNKNIQLRLKTTNSRHIKDSRLNSNIKVTKDKSTSMKLDGNNVDIDMEKVSQAENQLKYNALIDMANSRISNMSLVMRGGR